MAGEGSSFRVTLLGVKPAGPGQKAVCHVYYQGIMEDVTGDVVAGGTRGDIHRCASDIMPGAFVLWLRFHRGRRQVAPTTTARFTVVAGTR